MAYDNAEADEFDNKILMLHTPQEPPITCGKDKHAPQCISMNPNHVHFSESFYVADETDKLESYVQAAFHEPVSKSYYVRRTCCLGELIDCSTSTPQQV